MILIFSYGYKPVFVEDKFSSKPLKLYLRKDAVYNVISSIIRESKYCSNAMKNHLNKEILMTKSNNEDFMNSTKCWICDNDYVDGGVKVRDHCQNTGISRVFAHRYCNINNKINQNISVVFHKLKNYGLQSNF